VAHYRALGGLKYLGLKYKGLRYLGRNLEAPCEVDASSYFVQLGPDEEELKWFKYKDAERAWYWVPDDPFKRQEAMFIRMLLLDSTFRKIWVPISQDAEPRLGARWAPTPSLNPRTSHQGFVFDEFLSFDTLTFRNALRVRNVDVDWCMAQCEQHNFTAFVQYKGYTYFRSEPPDVCRAHLSPVAGAVTYVLRGGAAYAPLQTHEPVIHLLRDSRPHADVIRAAIL